MHKRKRKKQPLALTQCDSCTAKGCKESKQQECAKKTCMGLAVGEVYECPDREPGYWERLEAA